MMIELQAMDLIVTRDRTPISWWIRWQTNSRWSHVCVAGPNQTIYTTAWPEGFKQVQAEKYLKGKTFAVFRMPRLNDIHREAGIYYCTRFLGDDYDFGGVGALLLSNLRGKGPKGVENKKVYCAEQVTMDYRYMGFTLSAHLRKKPNAMLPADCIDPAMKLTYTNDLDVAALYAL